MSVRHGTFAGYAYYRCRCDQCRAANTAWMQEWRARPVEMDAQPHGTVSTYNNYGCRCEPCRQAKSVVNRERNRKRPSRAKVRP